jgi:hypothetical protein
MSILLIIGGIFIFLGIVLWGAALFQHQGGMFTHIAPGFILLTLGGIIVNAGHYRNKRGMVTE